MPPKRRILLIRDRDFLIHVPQLAGLLVDYGYEVEVLNTANGAPEPLYSGLIAEIKRRNVRCHVVNGRPSQVEGKLIAFAFWMRLITKRAIITPYKIRESRRVLANLEKFDLVVAVDPPSLYLACKLFPNELNKIVEYSLEVSDEGHGDFQSSRSERSFRYFERTMLPRIAALLIQDRFRAQVLLRHIPPTDPVKTIYFPIAIEGPGGKKEPRPSSMTGVRVLFFGGLWSQVFLQRLLELSAAFRDDQVLIIRGGRGDARPASMAGNKVDISTLAIPFNRINSVIATADVGLALYPIDEPNSRCSAFASEKVARYLQCGLPFIAFRNEDYAFLQSETGCCELVTDYAEVPQAVNRIVDNYDQYCSGAANAFARFYSRDKTAPELVRQLDILSSGGHA